MPRRTGLLLLTLVLTGCSTARGGANGASGNHSSSEVVARIGDAVVDRGTLDHWVSAVERGGSVATALGKITGTPREKALGFLISSSWIQQEARDQGLSISKDGIERALRQKIAAAPNGRAEFEEELASTGQGPADVRFEVKSALAEAQLRGAVAKDVPAVTPAAVAGYYFRHLRKFYLPDRRVAYLAEGIHSYTQARALAGQVRPGVRLALPWSRELVGRTAEVADRRTLAHMVFAATPGRVAGPAMIFGFWNLALVRKVIPAGIQPLAAVKSELSTTLAVQRREQALKHFAAAFARRWTAKPLAPPPTWYSNAHSIAVRSRKQTR